MQSTLSFIDNPGLHVAIIMDGNGRWAERRGETRSSGHRAGAASVRRVIEASPELGVTTLTLYAFSSDNWKRPAHEVETLMTLLADYLEAERARCVETGVRVNVIGRRDRLSPALRGRVAATEHATRGCRRLHLRIAVDYSARDAIVAASTRLPRNPTPTRDLFAAALNAAIHSRPAAPDVDLLIRTSGEQRLSDYLLWECAYAELLFCEKLWPDFAERDLARAISAYRLRERRFGGAARPEEREIQGPSDAGEQRSVQRERAISVRSAGLAKGATA